MIMVALLLLIPSSLVQSTDGSGKSASSFSGAELHACMDSNQDDMMGVDFVDDSDTHQQTYIDFLYVRMRRYHFRMPLLRSLASVHAADLWELAVNWNLRMVPGRETGADRNRFDCEIR